MGGWLSEKAEDARDFNDDHLSFEFGDKNGIRIDKNGKEEFKGNIYDGVDNYQSRSGWHNSADDREGNVDFFNDNTEAYKNERGKEFQRHIRSAGFSSFLGDNINKSKKARWDKMNPNSGQGGADGVSSTAITRDSSGGPGPKGFWDSVGSKVSGQDTGSNRGSGGGSIGDIARAGGLFGSGGGSSNKPRKAGNTSWLSSYKQPEYQNKGQGSGLKV